MTSTRFTLFVALALTAGSFEVKAQSWNGGSPVFQSDIDRRERQREAVRAERRKTYGNVVYPRYMDGGAKPDIAPGKASR